MGSLLCYILNQVLFFFFLSSHSRDEALLKETEGAVGVGGREQIAQGLGPVLDCGTYYGSLSCSSLFVTSAKPEGVICP